MTKLLNNLDISQIAEHESPGSFEKLVWLDDILIGSKITKNSQIDLLKENEIQLAIDFKSPEETSFDDQAAFESSAIDYINFPISDIDKVSFEDLCYLKKELEKYPGNKFIYCMSANRVGAIIALILAEVIGHSKQRSFKVACQVGLNKENLIHKVKDRLSIAKESA